VPKIYLDVCCLNQPFDNQTQARIHLEAEAILMILTQCRAGDWEWVGSEVIELGINPTPDPERRRRVHSLAAHVHRSVIVGKPEIERAQQFEAWGMSAFDSLPLACAESGGVDVFLTTDDRLLRKPAAYAGQLRVRVENPLLWLREVS
jgi:hypothetical protein